MVKKKVKKIETESDSASSETEEESLENVRKKLECKSKNSSIEKKLDLLIQCQEKLLKANESTNKKISDFQKLVLTLQKEIEKKDEVINELRDELNEFQQHYRSNYFEIHNLEEMPNESKGNLESVIQKVVEKVGIQLSQDEIEAFHRMPTRNRNAPKIIIVQLSSRKKRNDIIDLYKTKAKDQKRITQNDIYGNGKKEPIYINESLTKFNKELLYEAKKMKNEIGFKFAYSSSGKVFMKKGEADRPIRIKNFKEITEMKKSFMEKKQ